MGGLPLCGHIPSLTYVRRWVNRAKFMHSEDALDCWVLFAVEDGSFYYCIGGEEGTASFGDLVICPPGERFRRVVISPITLFVFMLNWQDDQGNKVEAAAGKTYLPCGKVSLHDTARLSSTYELLNLAISAKDPWSRMKATHYARDLWLQLCEEREGRPAVPSSAHPADLVDPVAEKAEARIREQAFQPVLMQDIASYLNISLSQLSKKFKKRFGVTPIEYLTSQRLEKAKALLLETHLTLEQISECCGYQSGFYLNRVFLKHMNMTPTQFRNSHRI